MKTFYFTFGHGQKHWGFYKKIQAIDSLTARKQMINEFGQKWSMQYNEEEWFEDEESQAEKWDYKELK